MDVTIFSLSSGDTAAGYSEKLARPSVYDASQMPYTSGRPTPLGSCSRAAIHSHVIQAPNFVITKAGLFLLVRIIHDYRVDYSQV